MYAMKSAVAIVASMILGIVTGLVLMPYDPTVAFVSGLLVNCALVMGIRR